MEGRCVEQHRAFPDAHRAELALAEAAAPHADGYDFLRANRDGVVHARAQGHGDPGAAQADRRVRRVFALRVAVLPVVREQEQPAEFVAVRRGIEHLAHALAHGAALPRRVNQGELGLPEALRHSPAEPQRPVPVPVVQGLVGVAQASPGLNQGLPPRDFFRAPRGDIGHHLRAVQSCG